MRVRCTVGGEINDNSTVNPSATVLPAFEVSADDGVTWLPVQTVSDHRNGAEILVAKLGLTVRFANGSVAPSFVVGDVWQFACSASETVKALVPAVCADMDDYLNATYDLPLSAAAPNRGRCQRRPAHSVNGGLASERIISRILSCDHGFRREPARICRHGSKRARQSVSSCKVASDAHA